MEQVSARLSSYISKYHCDTLRYFLFRREMEQGQSEESLIESGERSDVGRRRNTPAGELEAIAVVK